MAVLNANFNTQTSGIAVPALTVVGNDLLRVMDVNPDFKGLNTPDAVFYKLLTTLSRVPDVTQPKFHYFEDDLVPDVTTLDGGINDSVTSITLDDELAVVGAVIDLPVGDERMLITAVGGSGVYTVERGYQGTTATAHLDAAVVGIMPSTLEDGGAPKESVVRFPDLKEQYVAFVSESIAATDLQEATNMLNSTGQMSSQFAKITSGLMRKMNRAIMRQEISLDAGFAAGVTGNAAYYGDGLDALVTTSTELSSTSLTLNDLQTAFEPQFDATASSPTKWLVVSPYGYKRINEIEQKNYDEGGHPSFNPVLGALVQRIVLPSGNFVNIVRDQHSFYNDNVGTQGYLLDLAHVGITKHKNFDLMWRDVAKTEYHSEKKELFDSFAVLCNHGGSVHSKITFD